MKSISPAYAWTRSSTARLSRQGKPPKQPQPRRANASTAKQICQLIYAGATAIAETIGRPAISHDLAAAGRSRHRMRRLHHRQVQRGRPVDLCLVAQHRTDKPTLIQRRSPRCRPPTPQFPAPLRERKVMKAKQNQRNGSFPTSPLTGHSRLEVFGVCGFFG